MVVTSRFRYIPSGIVDLFNTFDVELVLDVGANVGQYSQELFEAEYAGEVRSFEPLSDAYQRLVQASDGIARWAVHERCAVGDRNGVATMNIAGNSQSSSILPMLESHQTAAPASKYVGTEEVMIRRLDDLVTRDMCSGRRVFLKIDVQGYERRVLEGAVGIMDQLVGIQLEMDVEELYDGGELLGDALSFAIGLGFSLYSLTPGFRDRTDGRLLQTDGVFFRREAAPGRHGPGTRWSAS